MPFLKGFLFHISLKVPKIAPDGARASLFVLMWASYDGHGGHQDAALGYSGTAGSRVRVLSTVGQ